MKKVLVIVYIVAFAIPAFAAYSPNSIVGPEVHAPKQTSTSPLEDLLKAVFSKNTDSDNPNYKNISFSKSASEHQSQITNHKSPTFSLPSVAFTSTSAMTTPSGALPSVHPFSHQSAGPVLSISSKYRQSYSSSSAPIISLAERDKRTARPVGGTSLAAGSFSAASTQPTIDATGTAVLSVGITPMAKGLGGGGVPIIGPEEGDEFLGPETPVGDALIPLMIMALLYMGSRIRTFIEVLSRVHAK